MYIEDCFPYLSIPHMDTKLERGYKVKLGRFQTALWQVEHGWYSCGGNRPVCGWHLINVTTDEVKPLQLSDLDDIYVIEI